MLNYFTFSLILLSLLPSVIKCGHDPSVIIVGAGAAGIAAASRLLENNFTNIAIFEAEGRTGGRIYSVRFGDAMVDLGAQWCHGRKNNVLYDLVKGLDLLEYEHPSPFRVVVSNQRSVDPKFVNELHGIFLNVYSNGSYDGSSLGDHLSKGYHKIINEKYRNELNKLRLAQSIYVFFLKSLMMRRGTFSLNEMPIKSDFQELPGEPSNWKDKGHKMILDVLTKKYPNPHEELPVRYKTRLYRKVSKIRWGGTKYVVVECSDGAAMTADHVIFTPSLGVLKHSHKMVFEPQLPVEKIRVIDELGIEAVVKVFLHFPTRWWPSGNFSGFSFAWTRKDVARLFEEFPEGPIQKDKHWLLELLGVYTVNKNPKVLLAWFTGELVPQIEFLPDETIIKGITFVLNKFLRNSFTNMTTSDGIVRYNWYSNSNFRGTYSFQTVHSLRKKEVSPELILSQPLKSSHGKDMVLFAGEATHPTYYSSVHGAIESGYREADRIIKFYR